MSTIENATSLDGFVIFEGNVIPYLWTHLRIYKDKAAAQKDAIKAGTKVHAVESFFEIQHYQDYFTNKRCSRLSTKPSLKRVKRPRV